MVLKYILLGVIQGLTEFLPVSSSAHLVILQRLFCIEGNEIAITLVLHLGTTLSLLVFFGRDILNALRNARSMLLILIVTLITGAIGLSGKDFFESLFSSVKTVSLALMITGAILLYTRRLTQAANRNNVSLKDSFILGISQGLAIIPGISRSGITISTLLARRISPEESFRFSFLAAIPAIAGASLLEIRKIDFALEADFLGLGSGFIVSFLTGLLSLWILKLILRKERLYYFGYYCILIGILSFLFIK